jgi:hypothetical protein
MDRRYQVFVSSTFEDLREERAVVISALLQLDCFPAGMELFPAADEDSLTLIKSVIDDSDCYLILLAGRYGSCPPREQRSFTHLEYDYALSVGKPTIALLHSNPELLPAAKTERSDEGRKKRDDFREALKVKNCRQWKDHAELTSAVFTGVQHLKKTRPGLGWVKGSALGDEGLKDELLRVRRESDSLKEELVSAKNRLSPEGVEELAQGSDKTLIVIELAEPDYGTFSLQVSWGRLMRAILPLTFGGGATPKMIAGAIAGLVRSEADEMGRREATYRGRAEAIVPISEYGKVLNQMVALGLIEGRRDPHVSAETIWFATPFGLQTGARMLAITRAESPF